MKYNTKLCSVIIQALAVSRLAYAETFKCVVVPSEYGGTGVGVMVDDTPVPMTSSINGLLWTAKANKPKSGDYYYVITDQSGQVIQSEASQFNITRKWGVDEDGGFQLTSVSTLNEVFGRRYNLAGNLLKPIPRIYDAPPSYKKYSLLFQEGQVPVIRATINQQDYDTFIADTGEGREAEYLGNLDIITPTDVFQFTNITLSLSGMGSRGKAKRPFKINLSESDTDSKKNTEIYKRNAFKLRNCVYDSTFLRNKLAVDLASSLGLPAGQSSHARFYLNNAPYGLYDLSDNLKKKFLRIYLHNAAKKKDVTYGTWYKGVSTKDGDLSYQAYLFKEPANLFSDMYQTTIIRDGAQPLDDINEIINWIDQLKPDTPEKEIRDKFDVDTFLKYMAIEYLIEQWDGYLIGGNNYYIYRKVDGTFTLLSFDFDLTFGKWAFYEPDTDFETFSLSKKPYGNQGPIRSQLYNKLLTREPFKTQLKDIIKDVVSRVFNTASFESRVNYFKEFLADDIYWDLANRANIPTKPYPGEEEEIPTFESVMEEYGYDKGGILAWIKGRSEFIAKTENLKLKADFSKGEVGGKIELDKDGESKVTGDIKDSASNIQWNTLYLLLLTLAVILL